MTPKTPLTDAERIEVMYAILKVKNVTIHGEKEWNLVAAAMKNELQGEQARSRKSYFLCFLTPCPFFRRKRLVSKHPSLLSPVHHSLRVYCTLVMASVQYVTVAVNVKTRAVKTRAVKDR